MLLILTLLLFAHFLADYPLQGDFLARGKNLNTAIPGIPWQQLMLAHVAIHGGFVALITGLWWLGVLEAIAHWAIDYTKCRYRITFSQDQALHLACKLLWLLLWGAFA